MPGKSTERFQYWESFKKRLHVTNLLDIIPEGTWRITTAGTREPKLTKSLPKSPLHLIKTTSFLSMNHKCWYVGKHPQLYLSCNSCRAAVPESSPTHRKCCTLTTAVIGDTCRLIWWVWKVTQHTTVITEVCFYYRHWARICDDQL